MFHIICNRNVKAEEKYYNIIRLPYKTRDHGKNKGFIG